jgi:hypothetical protein
MITLTKKYYMKKLLIWKITFKRFYSALKLNRKNLKNKKINSNNNKFSRNQQRINLRILWFSQNHSRKAKKQILKKNKKNKSKKYKKILITLKLQRSLRINQKHKKLQRKREEKKVRLKKQNNKINKKMAMKMKMKMQIKKQ